MKLAGYLIVNSLAVLIASQVIPGVSVADAWSVVVVVILLGVANTFIRPLLLLLTLPLNLVTLGLFTFVINAFLVMAVSSIVAGFEVVGFTTALLFSLVVSLVSWFLSALSGK